MTGYSELEKLIAPITSDADAQKKLCAHLCELFSVLDPAAVGEAYKTALEKNDIPGAVRACARYFREKPECTVPSLAANGPYDKTEADNASVGIMREINIDYTFPDGKIDFLFDPTGIRGPRNNEWLWQFNRHGYWHSMARAYADTKNEFYAEAFERQLLAWIIQTDIPEHWNGAGSAWRTIECGIRLLATWIPAIQSFRKSERFSDLALLLMLASMHRQSRHLTLHPTGGNWLMIEMNGVYAFTSVYPEFTDAAEDRKTSAARLTEELAKQFLPDGLQYELSPDYHSGVVNCVCNIYELAKAAGKEDELPSAFVGMMENAVRASVLLSTPALTQPRTNDTYTIPTQRIVRRVASLLPSLPEYDYILSKRQKGTPPAGETPSAYLPYSGFCAMRTDWSADAAYLCFDVGPLGMAHIHQDKLNINVYKGSEELIFDDGGGQYEQSAVREYAISAYDHNTVLVDGLAQNRTEPKRYTEPMDAGWISNDRFDYAFGVYDDAFGAERTKPAVHKREVRFCRPGFFVVADTLTSADGLTHDYELLFHLDTLHITQADGYDGALLSDYGKTYDILLLPLWKDGEDAWQIVSGRTEPSYRGWYFGRNDETMHPASTVSRIAAGVRDHRFVTLLFPVERNRPETFPTVRTLSEYEVQVTFGGKTDTVDIRNLAKD